MCAVGLTIQENINTDGGSIMDQNITELYKILNIPESKWPEYTNPYNFAKKIEKCALTKNVFTTTSDSSVYNSEPIKK